VATSQNIASWFEETMHSTGKWLGGTESYHYRMAAQVSKRHVGMEEIRTQNGVYTPVVFWIVRDLGILSKDDFATSRDHSQLGYIHLYNGTFGHDAELRIHWRLRIFLDANDLQLEGGLQIRFTGNMSGSRSI
jgi:hypothetical protein